MTESQIVALPSLDIRPLVSLRELEFALGFNRTDIRRLASNAGRYYRPFDRRVTRGVGDWRHIDNPTDPLRGMQRRIARRILTRRVLPATMFGAVPGRSIKDNVRQHINQPVVVTMDLRSCFTQVGHDEAYDVYERELRCSPDIARMLTKLTTWQGRIPQGAPSSPALVNLALMGLHNELAVMARSNGLRLSMWMDDIALSGKSAEDFIAAAIRIIEAHGHAVRNKKVFVLPQSAPQRVTGLLANQERAVGKAMRTRIRRRIIDLAWSEHPADSGIQSVWGQVRHLKWVSPLQGIALERLAARVLPEQGVAGPRQRSDEIRPCSHRRRHRRQ